MHPMVPTNQPPAPRRVIFDTDPGVDDALALYFALAHPGIDVLGITTTFGNVSIAQATANALLLCQLAGRQVPVAQGVSHPLVKALEPPPTFIHGEDGLGQLPHRPALRETADGRSAAQFIVDTVRAAPGEVSLVAVGPLGNLALALTLEPALPQLVRDLVLMGGTILEPGNVSPVAEANIWNDPHAADRVFSAGWPLTMVGLDVTHQVVVSVALLEQIALQHQHPATDALLHAFRFYARFYGSRHAHLASTPGCYAHDLLAFIYLIRPDLFTLDQGNIRVATEGLNQGQTVMRQPAAMDQAQAGSYAQASKTQACLKVQVQPCLDLLKTTLLSAWLSH
jgi:inosine-uridine nucleoside N-ribohydrolase